MDMLRFAPLDEQSKFFWAALEAGDLHLVISFLLPMPTSEHFVNKKKDGRAPIHIAAQTEDIELLRCLLDKGAEVEAVTNKERMTALQAALLCGLPDHANLLLSRGASLTPRNKEGVMAVHCAAMCGKPRLLTVLRQHRADLNALSETGVTALMVGTANGKMSFCRGLLDVGVRTDIVERKQGNTALHYAAGYGHVDIARMLLDANADVNKRRMDGGAPLHLAATKGHPEVVKLLLQRGADASLRNNDGQTPADIAATPAVRSALPAGGGSARPAASGAAPAAKAPKGGAGPKAAPAAAAAPAGAPKARASGGGRAGGAADDLARWLSGLGIADQVLPVCSALGLAALPDVRLVREADLEKLGVAPVVRRKFVEAASLVPSAQASAAPPAGGAPKAFRPQPFPDYATVGAAAFDGHAERLAAAYMRWLGFKDAAVNGGVHTPDRGIDVVSARAVAQVKANFRGAVKRPALAQLVGDASLARYQACELLFFAVSYAPDAAAYATEVARPVALFAFDAAGDVRPRNAPAQQMVARARHA